MGLCRTHQPDRHALPKRGNRALEYSLLEGSCHSGEVKSYLDALAEKAEREGKPCVVVLNNAPFHTSGMIREREEQWEAKGLRLYRLPAYCPHLNLIEGVWRRLKGFLMPRRFYDSVAELKEAVLHGLHLLGLWKFNIRLEILSLDNLVKDANHVAP
jgi:putative transposase